MRNKLMVVLFFLNASCLAQTHLSYLDSIYETFSHLTNDEDKVRSMILLSGVYSTINYDSASMYGQKALNLAEQKNFDAGRVASLCILGIANTRGGNLSKALEFEFKGLQLSKEKKLKEGEALCYYTIGKSYYFLKDYANAVHYCSLARQMHLQIKEKSDGLIKVYYAENDPFLDNDLVLAEAFMDNNELDSALVHYRRLYYESVDSSWKAIISIFFGDALFRKGEKTEGLQLLKNAFYIKQDEGDDYSLSWASSILARCYKELNQTDSSIYYAKQGLQAAQQVGFKDRMLMTSRHLAQEYEKMDTNKAYSYLKLATTLNDGLFGQEKVFELQKTLSDAQQHQQELENKQIDFQNKIRLYLLLSGLTILLGIAIFLYYNNKKEKKAKSILENTLKELKATQAQLIQSEKMASLGEVTAGIAHEIQNPLNFVNNFSELNSELVNELSNELKAGNTPQALDIAKDIKVNSEKINQHGQRASSIVKGMLEHSRESSGEKKLTDINALCDEYLRFSYQGLRAQSKNINIEYRTDLDPNMPNVNVVSRDIARVLLNLFNNAFQACAERGKMENEARNKTSNLSAPISYLPLVTVKTKFKNSPTKSYCEISISDNGTGIPESIKDKIFQPFFTTKPTGQGTGLGLSLAYDIVKAHGGEIIVDSTVGIGAEFKIILQI